MILPEGELRAVIRDAIQAYEDALWKPIETAPMYESICLTNGTNTVSFYMSSEFDRSRMRSEGVTRWHPFPQPPGDDE